MTRHECALIVIIFFVLMVWSATGTAQQQPSDDDPFMPAIGVALPLSGEYAPLGKQLLETAELAARDAGVRVVTADTKGEPAGATAAITKLAAHSSVVAIVGPIGERESRAAATVARRLGVPIFLLSSVDGLERVGPHVYRVRLSPAEQATRLAARARKSVGVESVGIVFPENRYGREAATAFARRFRALGGEVKAVASYPEETTDFREPLDVLVGKKVQVGEKVKVGTWRADGHGYARIRKEPVVDFDALFVPDFHHRVARLVTFLPRAGIQNGAGGEGVAVQLLGMAAWQGKAMEMTGSAAAGALYLDTFAGAAAGGREEEFSRLHEGKLGRRPSDVEAETFDITWLLGSLARKAAGDVGAEAETRTVGRAVEKELPRKDVWRGVAGRLKFGEAGEPLRELELYRFDVDGQVVPMQ